ncbi:epimerase family protein SDR39U1 isoform 2-T2 [Passerculus sandwichensis]
MSVTPAQEELSHSGLPLCEAVVNLAGENVLNPFRRWNDDFCREVVSSRVETTKALAKAIGAAEQPPRAWVLVTGVGFYRPSPTAEYTEDSAGGDFDFFSRLVSCWAEMAAQSPRCSCLSAWDSEAPWALDCSPSRGSTSRTWLASCVTRWRRSQCEASSTAWPRPRLAPPMAPLPRSWRQPWGAQRCCRCPPGPCGLSLGQRGHPCCWRDRGCCPNAPWRAATASSSLSCPQLSRTLWLEASPPGLFV